MGDKNTSVRLCAKYAGGPELMREGEAYLRDTMVH